MTMRDFGIDRLPVADRLALAREILDSVAVEEPRPTLTEAKRKELDRRLAELAADPSAVVPWEEVEAAARARFTR